MKKVICLVCLFSFLLCGCSKRQYPVGTFSYTKHCAEYGSAEFGVYIPDPESQMKTRIRNAADAVEVAKKYCRIPNPEISVDYDIFTGVYCPAGYVQTAPSATVCSGSALPQSGQNFLSADVALLQFEQTFIFFAASVA